METLRTLLGLQKGAEVVPYSANSDILFEPGSASDLQKRLELRDIFRDEQLFNALLPRAKSATERWLQPGPAKSWVDQCTDASQFFAMDHSHVFFSSALSGLVVSTISTPFDVVKNYWIYSPNLRGPRSSLATKEVVQSLYKFGGMKSFYTGYTAACCTIIPANLIFFWSYEHTRNRDPPAIAGMKARGLAVCLTMPAEFVRTKLQANVGTLSFVELYKTLSVFSTRAAYFKGVTATLMRDMPFSALYWTMNEYFKRAISEYDEDFKNRSNFRAKFVYPFISGATAAAIATTLTQPFDVLKTNIQGSDLIFKRRGVYFVTHASLMSFAKGIYQAGGGYGAFWVGLVPRLAKIIPSCAVLLATYDFSKSVLVQEEDSSELEFKNF